MLCPQCDTPATPGGRFCGHCGIRLPAAAPAGAGPGTAPGDALQSAADAVLPPRRYAAPSLTLAVVACVVVLGLVLVSASAVVRRLDGETGAARTPAGAQAASARRGPMGALLEARHAPAADPGKLR